MTSRRARRYGTLLSVVLALLLATALAACTDDEGDPGGTPGSLLERAAEREATPEAESSGSQSLFGLATPGPTEEGEPSATDPTPTPTPTAEEAAERDRAALVALYRATGGDSWTDNDGWRSDEPIGQWHGVTVDADGRVTALTLDDNNLAGTVPPELHALTALARLDLGENVLDGCLPADLQDQLDIADSDLAGLSFCVNDRAALVALYRATDGDSWTDNAGWRSDAPIGQWHGVTVDASGRVTALALAENNLAGTVPPELHALTTLTQLDLGGNVLDGCLPVNLQGQLEVVDSDLAGLPFCCGGHGTPPGSAPAPKRPENPPPAQTSAETDRDALLAIFEATDGDSWDGSDTWAGHAPIGEWAGVTTNENGRVVGLDLRLGGAEIPSEVGHLTGLTALTLSGVSGALPPELGYLVNLANLDLSHNELCGKIPPELGGLGSLQTLNLGDNKLTGGVPTWLGGLGSLQSLNLGDNQLTGKIPPELGGLGSLQSLNLGDNQLTGKIPPELGGLGSLQSLDLESNQLTGDIPPELDNLVSTLREIGLDGNQLGCVSDVLRDASRYAVEIPVCAPEDHPGDTEALISLYNAWGQPDRLSNWLSREPLGTWEGVSVDATGRVAALNLAGKRLTGEISPELSSLASLQVLDLSINDLTGEIPAQLGGLGSLQSLNLSGNELTGELPELGSLESLKVLDMAGNLLTGGGNCVPTSTLSLHDSILEPLGELCAMAGEFASVSSSASNYACGVKRHGSVTCWIGNVLDGHNPASPEGEFVSVSVGSSSFSARYENVYACGVKRDGSVTCWGNDEAGQASPPEGQFASVSAGGSHTCGVRTDGSVACWGDDEAGQASPPEGQFASVSAGGEYTCGVRTDGSVACWGEDYRGSTTPPEGQFASVSAGWDHTCGVKTDGSVACWGNNNHPDSSSTSYKARPPEGQFASVSAGLDSHTCGVKTDGSVACWGGIFNSRLGHTTPPAGEFASVSAGEVHTCGVRTNGTVACWGQGYEATVVP